LSVRQFNLLAILAAVGLLATYLIVQRTRRPVDSDSALGLLNLGANVKYVGDSACRICHESIGETYSQSGMARSWSVASPERFAIASLPGGEVTDSANKFTYRAFEESGQFFQEEYRQGADGERTHSLQRPISFVVGSGNHGLSLINEHNGFLTLLPLGWYSEQATWDLSPGYRRQNARFDRVAPVECIACHNDLPRHVAGSHNRFELPLPNGIGCERCHGPGELHVAKQSNSIATRPTPGDADLTIVNPRRLPIDRRDDVCLQCHLISDVAVLAPGKEWVHYRPGQRLAQVRHDLFLKPEDPARFGFSSHATRLRSSRCWSEGTTRGQLTCIRCHDPHLPLNQTSIDTYIETCLSCHGRDDCNRDRSAEQQTGMTNCIGCHMRKGKPENVAHTVFTDHWIRARPEPLDAVDPALAARFDPKRPIELIDFWEGAEAKSPTLRALAIALYLDLNRISDQRQAIAALETALEHDEKNPDLHFWFGVAMAKTGNWRSALANYEKAAAVRSDAMTLYSLGEAQRATGRLRDAVQTLSRVIEEFPDNLSCYKELAETHAASKNLRVACEVLDRSIARFPFQGDVRIRRAHLGYQAGESLTRVQNAIAEARRLQPDDASLHWLDGQCFIDQGKRDPAIAAFEAALAVDPRFVPALLALGPLLAEAGRFEEARTRLEQLRAVAPNHPMLGQAEQELNRTRGAKQ